jgi:hypothetical protein
VDPNFFRKYSDIINKAEKPLLAETARGDAARQTLIMQIRKLCSLTGEPMDHDEVLALGNLSTEELRSEMAIYQKQVDKLYPNGVGDEGRGDDYNEKMLAFKKLGLDQHQWEVFEITWDYCHGKSK